MALKNYVLGRGKLYLSRLRDPQIPGPFRYVGNTTEFNMTAETETLEHQSSDAGINEVDDQVQLGVTRTGTFTMDDIQPENLALFFFGSATKVSQAVDTTNQTLVIEGADLKEILERGEGHELFLGVTAANPVGLRNLDVATLALAGMNSASTKAVVTLVKDVPGTPGDWEIVDAKRGIIRLLNTTKTFGTTTTDAVLSKITVTYKRLAFDYDQVISSGKPFEAAVKFLENNPKGRNNDWTMPFVTITPNGDLALKSENEWRTVPFSMTIQKPSGVEAIYINGVPE